MVPEHDTNDVKWAMKQIGGGTGEWRGDQYRRREEGKITLRNHIIYLPRITHSIHIYVYYA